MSNDYDAFDVSIFIVTHGMERIHCCEYDIADDGDACFMMLTSDMLNPDYDEDDTIYMDLEHFKGTDGKNLPDSVFRMANRVYYTSINSWKERTFIWQADMQEIPGQRHVGHDDTHGYANTMNIILHAPSMLWLHNMNDDTLKTIDKTYVHDYFGILTDKEQMFPAVFAAYSTTTLYDGKVYHGYLPAIMQIYLFLYNISLISTIVEEILGMPNILDIYNECLWSSSCHSRTDVFRTAQGLANFPRNKCSNNVGKVLPLYSLSN